MCGDGVVNVIAKASLRFCWKPSSHCARFFLTKSARKFQNWRIIRAPRLMCCQPLDRENARLTRLVQMSYHYQNICQRPWSRQPFHPFFSPLQTTNETIVSSDWTFFPSSLSNASHLSFAVSFILYLFHRRCLFWNASHLYRLIHLVLPINHLLLPPVHPSLVAVLRVLQIISILWCHSFWSYVLSIYKAFEPFLTSPITQRWKRTTTCFSPSFLFG